VDGAEDKAYHPTYVLPWKICCTNFLSGVWLFCHLVMYKFMCGWLEELLYSCCTSIHYQFFLS